MTGAFAIAPAAAVPGAKSPGVRRRALTAVGREAIRLGGWISGLGARLVFRAEGRPLPAPENNADDWIAAGRVFPSGWQVVAHASWTARQGGSETDCPFEDARARENWREMFRFVMGVLAEERPAS